MLKRVLLVEDDSRLAEMLSLHLSKLDCVVELAYDGKSGLSIALSRHFDLIILDRNLPEIEGLEVCREIRKRNSNVRILMLTALSDELDLVVGFETGADDYVGKPFKLSELIARVKALLRRFDPIAEESLGQRDLVERQYGELLINLEKRRVSVRGIETELTPREFDLLVFLSGYPGRAYTREQILDHVWDSDVMGYEHSINTIIKRLRKKIECDSKSPRYIQTVRGVGYRFAEQ